MTPRRPPRPVAAWSLASLVLLLAAVVAIGLVRPLTTSRRGPTGASGSLVRLGRLPSDGSGGRARPRHQPPPGWPVARWSSGDRPLIATTIVHPEGDATFAAAAWLAPAGLRFTLVPGTQQPGGSWHTVGEIPPGQRASLVAVFNSGFKYIDIDGGFRAEGRTQVPLVPGEASFVIRSSGGAEVGAWGETIRDRNDIVAVRQNLKLIVAHGAAAKGLLTNHDGSWGSKHHQVQFTPRSGIGELRDGSLVYVAGPDLDLQQLADAFVAVHAVTAMQLDIHPNMTVFHLFDAGSGTTAGPAHALLDVMTAPLDRYLTTDRRDFIAVNER